MNKTATTTKEERELKVAEQKRIQRIKDLSYCAGVLDSEGCIQISKQKSGQGYKHYPKVAIGMKCETTISSIQKILGVGNVCEASSGMYILQAYGQKAMEIIELLGDDLIHKKAQADLLKDFFKNKTELNAPLYYQRMKDLKREKVDARYGK